jgi:hypothetical protein
MSVDTLTVVPQNYLSIPQFNRALGVGTCSPTTSAAVGNSPLVNLVYDYFSFTIIRLAGEFDNSSITSFTLTPAGGSTLTFNVNTFTYYSGSNESQWGSSDSYRNLVAGTTYTVQFFSGSTNVNTEGVTLERRNPKKMSDFYGATRNVPPASGALKLSWLKNAVKYKYSATMTAGEYVYNPPLPNQTARGWQQYFPAIGSITNKFLSGMINEYSGQQLVGILEFAVPSSNPSYYQLNFTIQTTQPGGPNNQWYLLKIGNALYYREDATYSVDTAAAYWTMWSWQGSTQNIVNGTNYAVEVIC